VIAICKIEDLSFADLRSDFVLACPYVNAEQPDRLLRRMHLCPRSSLRRRRACVNETGDMFTPAEHFCKVAAINHEVVDEKQRQMLALK